MKLNTYQKLMLNLVMSGTLDIGCLLCALFGINYVKQLGVLISPRYHYWLTILWGCGLLLYIFVIMCLSNKYKKRIKELELKVRVE